MKATLILEEPYVSDYLIKFIKERSIPVLDTPFLDAAHLRETLPVLLSYSEVKSRCEDPAFKLLTISEASLGWVCQHLSHTRFPVLANLFKNKVEFRKLLKPLFPDLYFRECSLQELKALPHSQLPSFPFVLKPTIGFLSLGVHIIADLEQWEEILVHFEEEISLACSQFPAAVIDSRSFILEQFIPGEEFAVDAYFDLEGTPVVTSILKRKFSSSTDVSDRIYVTSKEIIETHLQKFESFLLKLGRVCHLTNFPLHVELRVGSGGEICPIEVNPLRFGGWCTTADFMHYAFGIHSYEMFLSDLKPDWKAILKGLEGNLYSIIVLNNSTGFKMQQIESFDYEKLYKTLSHPLHVREIDFHRYPLFGFIFAKTPLNKEAELQTLLNSSLREYVTLKTVH